MLITLKLILLSAVLYGIYRELKILDGLLSQIESEG